MKSGYKNIVMLLLFLTIAEILLGTDSIQSSNYQISLLTISPGTDVYSLFGHTAVRVKDLKSEDDITYNYGTFDFKTKNFLIKFLRGKLPYQLSRAPFYAFMYEYNETQRSVTEQILDISQEETRNIVSFLEDNALPENKDYLYDFLYDNCSTRVRDLFNKKLNLVIEDDYLEHKTFRNMLHEYLKSSPWTKFGIDLIVASRADITTDIQKQMFLPDYLEAHMAKAVTFNDSEKKYAFMPSRQLLYFEKSDYKTNLFNPFNVLLSLSLILILLYFTKFKAAAYSIMTLLFVILGIGSMILMFMWFATDHYTTKVNYNLIWMSPLYLLLPFLPKKWNIILSSLVLVLTILCLLPIFPQAMPIGSIAILLITLLSLNIYFHKVDAQEEKVFIE